MPKQIRLSDEVYGRLEKELLPRESFNQAVERLLDLQEVVRTLDMMIGKDKKEAGK